MDIIVNDELLKTSCTDSNGRFGFQLEREHIVYDYLNIKVQKEGYMVARYTFPLDGSQPEYLLNQLVKLEQTPIQVESDILYMMGRSCTSLVMEDKKNIKYHWFKLKHKIRTLFHSKH